MKKILYSLLCLLILCTNGCTPNDGIFPIDFCTPQSVIGVYQAVSIKCDPASELDRDFSDTENPPSLRIAALDETTIKICDESRISLEDNSLFSATLTECEFNLDPNINQSSGKIITVYIKGKFEGNAFALTHVTEIETIENGETVENQSKSRTLNLSKL